ncbi:UNVERIFIED_ORG: hypothetical protein J3D59_002352 [Pseudomonas fluorescens]
MKINGSSIWYWLAGVFAFFAIAGVSIRYTSVFSTELYADREAWGQFGDYFGGVLNPLLSFAAFVTLLITLRVQLNASAANERWSRDQVREQRLFQLLNMVGQSAISAKYRSVYERADSDPYFQEGHTALHHAWHDFNKHHLTKVPRDGVPALERYEKVRKEFDRYLRISGASISVFVQSSFLLIDFIGRNGTLSDGFIQFSMGAVRAQMTESERMILWYSALCQKEYSHHISSLKVFGFVEGIDSETTDHLVRWRDELVECALVSANMRR